MRRSFTQPSTRRFLPRLEALESRWCPSAAAGVLQHGQTLVIQGDGSNDTIAVTDDGKGDVTASITLASGTKSLSATGINDIKIDAGGGNDTIGYALTGTLSQSEKLMLCLDKGSSQVKLDFSAGVTDAALAVLVAGAKGSNQITTQFGLITGSRVNLTECLGPAGSTTHVNFGGALSGSDATVVINGGAGADHVFAEVGDETNANLQFLTHLGKGASSLDLESTGNLVNSIEHFDTDGGAGGDTVTYDAKGVNVDLTSRLNLETCLGAGSNNITVTYSGVMDGELDGNIHAGAGDDTVNVSLTLDQGSTGRVHFRVFGGKGNDTLTYEVYDNSNPGGKSTLALLDAVLFSVLGHDTDSTTPNVKVIK